MKKIYKILLIGHSEYPKGCKKFLEFFGMPKEKILFLNINEENNLDNFEENFKKICKKEKELIVIADLTGGSPHKTAINTINNNNTIKDHYILSDLSMKLLMELALKATIVGIEDIDNEIDYIKKAAEKGIFVFNGNITKNKSIVSKKKREASPEVGI